VFSVGVQGIWLLSYSRSRENPNFSAEKSFTALPGWAGFLMFMMGGYMIFAAWLANPLLWYGLHSMLKGRHGRALVAGVVATGLGLLALPPCLEANSRDPQYVPHSAYWTWLASMSLLASAGGIFYFLTDVKAADIEVA
jgi:hypothetical protein